MQIGGLSIFRALGDKMRWHQVRQGILAENVANADTPRYIQRDLAAYRFGETLKSVGSVTPQTTNRLHISAPRPGGDVDPTSSPFEITPSGNGVTLEDEMMRVAGNDMDYQAVTALYTRSLHILKTAIGK